MNSTILTEAFKKLDILEEEDFNLGATSEIDDAKEFLDNDVDDDTLEVIDLEAENEDELSDSYVGKVILECDVCHSKIFEDADDVQIDEENQVANFGEECPYCFSTDGYKVIGQVAPFGQVEDEIEVSDDEVEPLEDGDIEDIDIEEDESEEDELEESVREKSGNRLKESKNLKEANGSNADYLMYCLSNKLINPKDVLMSLIKSADEIAIEDTLLELGLKDELDETLREGCNGKDCNGKDCDKDLDESDDLDNNEYTDNEALGESFKDVSITTDDSKMQMTSDDNGKVTVTTEPLDTFDDDFGGGFDADFGGHEEEGEGEMLAPLDDGTIEEISDSQPMGEEEFAEEEFPEEGYDDIDIDEFDEESFDNLGESYLKKVYENVNSFKTTSVKESKDKLKVEGLINFKSGSTKKTSFIFEAKDITKKGKLRFIGENREITRGKKAFTVSGRLNGKKFMCESLNYNYRAKDEDGKSTRLYGTIKTKK